MIQKDIDITNMSSFGIPARAHALFVCSSEGDLAHLSAFISEDKSRTIVLGAGTNTVFAGDYGGVVIRYTNSDIERISPRLIKVSAGVSLDTLVQWSIQNNLSGLEVLSGIPGSVGGATCLNAGAFGVTLSDTLESVEIYDW